MAGWTKGTNEQGVYWASVACIGVCAALEQYIFQDVSRYGDSDYPIIKNITKTSHRCAVHYHGAQEYYPLKDLSCY